MTETPATACPAAQQVQSAVRDLSQRVRAWWHKEGLGHTSEIRLTENGSLEAKFSCMLGLHVDELAYDEDASMPEAQRRALVIQRFRDRGLVLLDSPNEDLSVVDCDRSTEALRLQLKTTFPSCVVRSFESRGTRNGTFVLSTVHCLVRDLTDVYALPVSSELR
jgi:hypothetical protein